MRWTHVFASGDELVPRAFARPEGLPGLQGCVFPPLPRALEVPAP